MKIVTKIVATAIAAAACIQGLPLADAGAAGLRTRDSRTVVCVGESASDAEKQAAEMIAERLHAAGDGGQVLFTAEQLNDEPLIAGRNHIISVGTWSNNVVTRKTWGHWAMPAARREFIRREAQQAREGHNPDLLLPVSDGPDWRWPGDFSVFGFGHFNGSVGYIETGRNFYTLHLVANELEGDPKDLESLNHRFIIRITGSDSAGVVRAARVYLHGRMLHGIVPPPGADAIPADWTPTALGREQLMTAPPAWAPTGPQEGDHPATYAGWLQGYALQYAGFAQAAGVEPQRIWRLKYILPGGFRQYQGFLTPRASDNEVLIAEMADADAAARAARGLRDAARGNDWREYRVGKWNGWRSPEGYTFLAQGHFVVAESLPPEQDATILNTLGDVE